MAGIHLLRRAGVEVVFPQQQSCCGQPAYNSGFLEEARAVARAQIKAFSKADWPIVVPSGSCAGMMRHHYPEMFANDPEYFDVAQIFRTDFRAGRLSAQRPARAVQGQGQAGEGHLAFLVPRHARNGGHGGGQGAHRPAVQRGTGGIEREYECCGFGGTFSIKQPEISAAMVADKVEDIRSTGASAILSGDCGCLMNIGGAMGCARACPWRPATLPNSYGERING